MRTRQFRNAVPRDAGKVQILDALAVNVDVELTDELRNPFDNDPLGAVALVEKRGDDRKSGKCFTVAAITVQRTSFS